MARLRLSEMFSSVQGEGIWVGIPSVFVRISGCNLRCVWCDTPYASWRPEGPVLEVSEIAEQALGYGIRHVVLTGGEPMLFDGIEELAKELHREGRVLTVETAGTVYRELPCDLMSISPKLAHSTPPGVWSETHESRRLQPDLLQKLIDRYPYQLKFVVNPEVGDDLAEIEKLLGALQGVDPERVLLMPEGRDGSTLHRRARMLVPIALERGWRLTPRFHVDLFGDTRGT